MVLPRHEVALSVFTYCIDGLAHFWLDGAIHVLRAFERHGAPSRALRAWSGRWWTLWGTIDLVPTADKVLVATPAFLNPFIDATEVRRGRIVQAGGYANHGEPARLGRNELWLGGTRFVREASLAREMERRYGRRS